MKGVVMSSVRICDGIKMALLMLTVSRARSEIACREAREISFPYIFHLAWSNLRWMINELLKPRSCVQSSPISSRGHCHSRDSEEEKNNFCRRFTTNTLAVSDKWTPHFLFTLAKNYTLLSFILNTKQWNYCLSFWGRDKKQVSICYWHQLRKTNKQTLKNTENRILMHHFRPHSSTPL